jgi:hypothetical protein
LLRCCVMGRGGAGAVISVVWCRGKGKSGFMKIKPTLGHAAGCPHIKQRVACQTNPDTTIKMSLLLLTIASHNCRRVGGWVAASREPGGWFPGCRTGTSNREEDGGGEMPADHYLRNLRWKNADTECMIRLHPTGAVRW